MHRFTRNRLCIILCLVQKYCKCHSPLKLSKYNFSALKTIKHADSTYYYYCYYYY